MEGGWRVIVVWECEQVASAYYGSARFRQTVRRLGVPQPNSTTVRPGIEQPAHNHRFEKVTFIIISRRC